MTVSTPGRVGGTFLTGLVPFIRQTALSADGPARTHAETKSAIDSREQTQALNTPNCTDLPKQQKRFRSEAWLRLRQKQTFAESFNNGGTRLKGRI